MGKNNMGFSTVHTFSILRIEKGTIGNGEKFIDITDPTLNQTVIAKNR